MAHKSVPFGEALTFGWETFKKNALFLIGLYVAVAVITGVLDRADEYGALESDYIDFVIGVINFLVNMLFQLGIIAIMLKFRDGATPEFADLFNRLPLIFNYVVAVILYFLMVAFGLAFFIFPGIYLAVRFYFFGFFIVDEQVGPIKALQKSSALTEGALMDIFFLGVMLVGLNILGLLCLGFGLLVSLPVSALAVAHVFRHLQRVSASAGGREGSGAPESM
jgi:uncharacterized membrane protein